MQVWWKVATKSLLTRTAATQLPLAVDHAAAGTTWPVSFQLTKEVGYGEERLLRQDQGKEF